MTVWLRKVYLKYFRDDVDTYVLLKTLALNKKLTFSTGSYNISFFFIVHFFSYFKIPTVEAFATGLVLHWKKGSLVAKRYRPYVKTNLDDLNNSALHQ